MPICLYGIDFRKYSFGYVAGFGSANFDDKCWTTKEGPNAYTQCKHEFEAGGKKYKEGCAKDVHPGTEDVNCKDVFEAVGSPRESVKRVYVIVGKERHECPPPGSFEEHGWCEVEPHVSTWSMAKG